MGENYDKRIWECTEAYKEKNISRLLHIRVYRNGVKLLSDTPFLMSNFKHFPFFLRFIFIDLWRKNHLLMYGFSVF